MSLFPILRPLVPQPPEPETPRLKIENADRFSPEVLPLLAESAEYFDDLGLTDPTLSSATAAIAAKAQQVAMFEEIDKQLGEQISLDERLLKAKTGIHGKVAKHQQFLASNQTKLQEINQAHLLAMQGHVQQQAVQKAGFNGIVAARQKIADRMRGA